MRIITIASYGLIAIGVLHFIVGVMMYRTINLNFLWFISASMGLIYSGVLNLVFSKSNGRSKGSFLLVQICNFLNILFGSLALYLIGEIQVVIILISLLVYL